MKLIAALLFLATLAGCADMRGLVRIEQASTGKSYSIAPAGAALCSLGARLRM
jgi:hypothetical protein